MADYNEIIKKLRERNGWALNETLDAAADAIEELQAHLDFYRAKGDKLLRFAKEALAEHDCMTEHRLTNGMKRRLMTDDEFALWLSDLAEWLPQYAGKPHAILKWLKQEATE